MRPRRLWTMLMLAFLAHPAALVAQDTAADVLCRRMAIDLEIASATDGARIVGEVYDRARRPVRGAVIVVLDSMDAPVGTALSSANGAFAVDSVPRGPHDVSITLLGHQEQRHSVFTRPGLSEYVCAVLQPAPFVGTYETIGQGNPMTHPEQRLSLVTLGVRDLAAATAFYRDVLGWTPADLGGGEVTFFQMNGVILGLWPATELAADAGVEALESGGLSRVALAHNVRTRGEVDALLEYLAGRGVRILKPATDTPWGGRSGYFADPDGFVWEVAWNPGFTLDAAGNVTIPE